ncbi:PAS domain S-box protein [Conexibacter sp. SYSU D00693]|uniref:sensor histidine kinase n=1 Tax=Conexibacter sp. SYSU D00693 TaxID=2812560 RepID=UPI00196ACF44|nr:PAS domain S-box protein [Conexibacter sp. SYSU D00693]
MTDAAPAHPEQEPDLARHLGLLIQSVGDYAIFLLDQRGYVQTWNRGAERMKGYRADEIIGRHFSTFYQQEDVERDHPGDELAIATAEGRYEEEGWRVRKDGSRFWANVTITAIRDHDGTLLGFGKVTRDLTARRLSEEQLRASAATLQEANQELDQFRRLVASVRDYAIFMLDAGGFIASWNAGAQNIKQYAAEEAIGRHFSIFYTQPDKDRDHPAYELQVAAAEGRYEEEGWRVRKDGSTFWASVTITAVRNDHGVLVGFAKVTRDLTERRAAEEELRRTQERLRRSNHDLQQFAAVAAHDLSEPLHTAAGFADLLVRREGDRLSAEGREVLDQLTASVGRMRDLISDVLSYARLVDVPSAPATVQLRPAVERVVAALEAAIDERGARVELDVPEGAAVSADVMSVELVLQNLLANGLKFGDGDTPLITIAAEPERDGWCIAVTDNGSGIPVADQDRIFGAFEQVDGARADRGSGLGLAIARRHVDRYGGQIGVQSSPGSGSRFFFWLPGA